MALFPQTGVPSCHGTSLSDEMSKHDYDKYPLTERYRFLGFAPSSRGRLAVDVDIFNLGRCTVFGMI